MTGDPPRDGPERRRAPRVEVALDLELARKVGNPVAARTLDVSTGGACITCRRPLRIDEELHFDLRFPSPGGHVEGTARVVRQPRHDVYALRFESLPPEEAGTLAAALVSAGGERR